MGLLDRNVAYVALGLTVAACCAHLIKRSFALDVTALIKSFFPLLRKVVDQRFADASEEMLFKASLERPLVRSFLFFGLCCHMLTLSGPFLQILQAETRRQDNPFLWGAGDLRTFRFCFKIVSCLAIALVQGFGLLYVRSPTSCLRILDLERLVMGISVVLVVGVHACPAKSVISSANDSHWEPGRYIEVIGMVTLILMICSYMPMRSITFWFLHAAALIPFVILFMAGSLNVHCLLFLLSCSCFSFATAHRCEQHMREKWIALRESVAFETRLNEQDLEISERSSLAEAMDCIAKSVSGIVVKLGADMTVVGSSDALDSLFGVAMEGELFAHGIDVGDRIPFLGLCNLAVANQDKLRANSQGNWPYSIRFKLPEQLARREGQLFVVHTNCRQFTWLVAVRMDDSVGLPWHPDDDSYDQDEGANSDSSLATQHIDDQTALVWKEEFECSHKELVPSGPCSSSSCISSSSKSISSIRALQSSAQKLIGWQLDSAELIGKARSSAASEVLSPVVTSHGKRCNEALVSDDEGVMSAHMLTPSLSCHKSLLLAMKHWNPPRRHTDCCPRHTVVRLALLALGNEMYGACDPLWSPFSGWQCDRCLCMNRSEKMVCDMCGNRPSVGISL